jgi:hypothetical protein
MNKYSRDFGNPWCWQEKRALRLIRAEFRWSPKRMTTCLTIYLCLTELESNNSSKTPFYACNSTIAKMAGKSISTIKAYCNFLISLELLHKETRKKGKQNLANKWFLLKTPSPPVNNSYPTPNNNNCITSDKKKYPVLEEHSIENNLNRINNPNKIFESDGFQKLKKVAYSLKKKI